MRTPVTNGRSTLPASGDSISRCTARPADVKTRQAPAGVFLTRQVLSRLIPCNRLPAPWRESNSRTPEFAPVQPEAHLRTAPHVPEEVFASSHVDACVRRR